MSGVKAKGAIVVVTGAGSGIGRATALRFSRAGAEVVCVDIDVASAAATAAACSGAATPMPCDVSDSTAVSALADEIERDIGAVDIAVNNAGVGIGGPFLDAAIADWDWLMGVNLDGVAYGCHAFGGPMVRRGRGQIVNVASGAAYVMSRDMAAYCASKAAVVALSRCLRADWAGRGVGVSAICPGVINTPIASHTRMFGGLSHRQDEIQRRFRLGHPPDLVAKAIVRAAERDDELVPVGLESRIAYRLLPFVPGPAKSMLARVPLGRVL